MTSTTFYGPFLLMRVERTINISFLQCFFNSIQIGVSILKRVQLKATKGLCGGGREFKFSLTYVRTLVKNDTTIQDCII